MKINTISREVTYRLTDSEGKEHCYTIASTFDKGNDQLVTHIYGTHPYEEIEVPTSELPFLVETLNLFAQDYSLMKKKS